MNESWFQSQPENVQKAIREEGRKAEAAVFEFGVANLERATNAWKENGGTILKLSVDDRKVMMSLFSKIGGELLSAKPEIKSEYDKLIETVEAKR